MYCCMRVINGNVVVVDGSDGEIGWAISYSTNPFVTVEHNGPSVSRARPWRREIRIWMEEEEEGEEEEFGVMTTVIPVHMKPIVLSLLLLGWLMETALIIFDPVSFQIQTIPFKSQVKMRPLVVWIWSPSSTSSSSLLDSGATVIPLINAECFTTAVRDMSIPLEALTVTSAPQAVFGEKLPQTKNKSDDDGAFGDMQ